MPRARTGSFGGKSDRIGKMAKLLEDDERCSSRCGSSYQRSHSRSSVYFGNFNSSNVSAPRKQASYAASSSSSLGLNESHSLTTMPNGVVGSSDESGSDFDIESGNGRLLDSHGVLEPGDWANRSVLSPVNEQSINKEDSLGVKAGPSSRYRGQSVRPLGWRDRYVSQPARLHDSMSKNIVDGRVQRGLTSCSSQRLRKGSSSKAPQTDDLTAPLLLEKKSTPVTDKVFQGESEGPASVSVAALGSKSRNASNLRRVTHSTSISIESASRKKGNSQAFYGHHTKSEETGGAGHKDMSNSGAGSSRRGLSNLVCSSAADVLPSVSTSALSNFACSSAADVLPSVPSTLAGTRYFRPRKSSRALGLEGEVGTSMQPVKRQAEEVNVLGMRQLQNELAHDQVRFGSGLTAHESTRAPQSREEPPRTNFVTCETSMPALTAPSRPNYRQWGRNVSLSRSGDGLGSLYGSSSAFFEANAAYGEELSNPRRRSLYGSRADPVGPDSRSSSRNLPHGRPSSSTWTVLRETHYPQSRFPGPPARPPPLPPLAGFAESNPSESSFPSSPPHISTDYSYSSRATGFILPGQAEQSSAAALAEAGSFNRSMNSGEGRPRLTVEGLSEILSALEYIERDEDLSYEQILMLEATILLGGIGLHDRYRDMRIDIDNMSYEELLALEERIGNVNTGLSEESVVKSVRVEGFSSPDVNCGYVPQEVEIKCSICQEEFEEAVELGVLECGHSHHIACIKQWLLQKNQCPICKAPAMIVCASN